LDYKSFIRDLTSERIVAAEQAELNKIAAAKFVSLARSAIVKNGRFTVALAGGSTPKGLYELLATGKFRALLDWSRVYFFFGDERNVAPDDAESNFRMANETLLEPLKIKPENIFRWRTELENAEAIAENYEKTIKGFFDLSENEFPRFNLILLGMGDDGHTASLFPFTEALREREKIAVANPVEKLDAIRLTLTFPAINTAASVAFLVSGENKAEVLRRVLEGESEPEKYPSQTVKPKNGSLFWLLDRQAAKNLR
jgi:6-phosphogluconolactonase